MLIHRYGPSGVSTTSTSWSGNTLSFSGAVCNQVLIKPATSSTTFDVSIIDNGSREIRKWENIKGLLNDLTQFPVVGVCTVNIINASANEPFTVMLCFLDG